MHYLGQEVNASTEHSLVQNGVVWDSAWVAAGRFGAGGGSHSRSGASGRHFVLPEREGGRVWVDLFYHRVNSLSGFFPPLNISLKSLGNLQPSLIGAGVLNRVKIHRLKGMLFTSLKASCLQWEGRRTNPPDPDYCCYITRSSCKERHRNGEGSSRGWSETFATISFC